MGKMAVGDLTVNVRRIGVGPGNGPTVVMLHGLSADNLSSLYYTIAPPVSRFADVILYDLRGHGRTDRPATGYGLDDSVADLAALLETLEVTGPVHLVGHSYGGAVAIAYAIERPDRVATLTMLEGHVALEGWAPYQAASIAFLAYSLEKPEVVEWMYELAPRKALQAYLDVKALIHETSLVHDIEHRTTTVTESDIRGIHLPVLALYGDSSDVLDSARDLEAWLPDLEFHLIEGHNHTLLLPCADLLAATITPWVRGHAADRGELGEAAVGEAERGTAEAEQVR